MFIAQIKPPSVTLHPVVGLVHSARCCGSLAGCLKLQSEALSQAPGEFERRGEKLSFPVHTDATKPVALRPANTLAR